MDIKLIYDEENDVIDIEVEPDPAFDVFMKYKPYIQRHNYLVGQIDYPLTYLKDYSEEELFDFAYQYEADCKEDIELIPFLEAFHEEHNKVSNYPITQSKLPYIVFKKLSHLYEIMGEYELAVSVCDYAIQKGYDYDGTKNGMQGRKERLMKRMNKVNL